MASDTSDTGKKSKAVAVTARQKRWTPRTRTGCKTCRLRRIKCDEGQPTCHRCRIRGVTCEYPIGSHLRSKTKLPVAVLQPPEWGFAEALRYHLTVTLVPRPGDPVRKLNQDQQLQLYRPDMHISQHESIPSFVMMVTHLHIQNICKANQVKSRPGAWPGINHLWRMLFEHITKAVGSLNQCIAANYPPRYNLFRVVDLLSVEMDMVDSVFWQAHCKGFLALVKAYGGVDAVINSSANPSPMLALQFVFINGLICDTTGTVFDRLREFDEFSEEEIRLIYSNMYFRTFPCPSSLFLAMVRISRLRIAAESLTDTLFELQGVAAETSDEINSFEPCIWTETYKLPQDSKIYTFARIFKASTILYALLSLPAPLSMYFCREHALDNTDTRLYWRTTLLQGIEAASHVRAGLMGMCWPLAVLGVSLYDGADDERSTVIGWLKEMELIPSLGSAPATLQGILAAFWASGKSDWEGCFPRLCQIAS